MNIKLTLKDKKLNENEIELTLYDEDEKKFLNKTIIVNVSDKRVNNLKSFFVELVEESFLNDERYDIEVNLTEGFKDEIPRVIELLEECIESYKESL